MIKAIIFDCFGVLISENWLAFKQQHFGDDPAKFQRASELNRLVDMGVYNQEEYVNEISKMAHMPPDVINKIFWSVTPNQSVLDMLAPLKTKYKLGMLSNISSDDFLGMFKPQEVALFDDITLSYKIGITKPDPRAFQIAATNLGEPCENCLFVDDQPKNITAAKEQGMQGIIFTSLESLDGLL